MGMEDKLMSVDMEGEDRQLAGVEGMKLVDTLLNQTGMKDMEMELGRLSVVGKELQRLVEVQSIRKLVVQEMVLHTAVQKEHGFLLVSVARHMQVIESLNFKGTNFSE